MHHALASAHALTMKSLQGCTVLITGASSGIGAELARQLSPHAKTMVLAARRTDRLNALAKELTREGLDIYCESIDVRDGAQIGSLVDGLKKRSIHVDFLINNAGLGDHGFFENSEWDKTAAQLEVNIMALTQITHALLPDIIKAQGAILNISSVAGYLPLPGMAVYAATKAYVTSFSEALRGELYNAGVTVTTICPGPVITEFGGLARRSDEPDAHIAPNILKVTVEEVAQTALQAVEKNRAKVVPGSLISFLMFLTSFVPFGIIRRFFYKKR